MAKEKIKYVVNNSFISHDILGIVFPKGKFVAIEESKLAKLKENPIFASLWKTEAFDIRDEIDESMQTTEEKLQQAKEEAVALKEEALAELAKRDDEIANLKAKLAAAGIPVEGTEETTSSKE